MRGDSRSARAAAIARLDSDAPVPLPWQKRALDCCVAGLALAACSPLLVAIALAELAGSALVAADRGGVLYRETRISAGRPFALRKFRILRAGAIRRIREEGAVPKLMENEPGNLTAIGRWLKRTGLDELPQFASVLAGDMTLVGPRPKPVAEYEAGLAEGLRHRTVMRAGLTGPAQLLKGTRYDDDDAVLADLLYIDLIRHSSGWRVLGEDLRLLGRTVLHMFKLTGE